MTGVSNASAKSKSTMVRKVSRISQSIIDGAKKVEKKKLCRCLTRFFKLISASKYQSIMYKDGDNFQSSVVGGIITLVFIIFFITVACVMVLNFFDREHYNLTQRYKCLTMLKREVSDDRVSLDELRNATLDCSTSSKNEVVTVDKFLDLLSHANHSLRVRQINEPY